MCASPGPSRRQALARGPIHTDADNTSVTKGISSSLAVNVDQKYNGVKTCSSPPIFRKKYHHLGGGDSTQVEPKEEPLKRKVPQTSDNEQDQDDDESKKVPHKVSAYRTSKLANVKSNNDGTFLRLCFSLLVFVVVVVVGGAIYFRPKDLPNNLDLVQNFESNLASFKSKFPSLESDSLRTIKAAVKSILRQPEPPRPAVIVLLPKDKTMETTVECFAKMLARTIDKSYDDPKGITYFDGTRLGNMDSGECKHVLDANLTKGFEGGKHTAVVHHLEHLSAECVLAFHSFCDDTNAPFKNVVFIFSVYVDNRDEDYPYVVTRPWIDSLSKDELPALDARIGANKVVLKPNGEDCSEESMEPPEESYGDF